MNNIFGAGTIPAGAIMAMENYLHAEFFGGIFFNKKDEAVGMRIGHKGTYVVTREGHVFKYERSKNGWRLMYQHPMSGGYLQVYIDGQPILTHRLVAECFCEPKKGRYEVNHRNGDKYDNRAENLEWVNRSENMKHAYKLGLHSLTGGRNRLRSSL